MPVYISILDYADGGRDVEVLDTPPTGSFHESITSESTDTVRAEIREGNMNGGDSVTIWLWLDQAGADRIAAEYVGTLAQARAAGLSRGEWVEGCLDDIADRFPGIASVTLDAIARRLAIGGLVDTAIGAAASRLKRR